MLRWQLGDVFMSDVPEIFNARGNFLSGAAIALSTRANNPIPNERRQEHPLARREAARALWTRRFPEIRVRSLSSVYNCMGMVFGSRRAYIDPEEALALILRDD